jgi:hypothetical protein
MNFLSKLFKKSNKIYITYVDNIYNLSENESKIDKLIEQNKRILTDLSINPEYIRRMIYYIESLYRSELNIINDENALIECINKDCVLFEMMIDLPSLALEKGEDNIYAQVHQNRHVVTLDGILDNPGYIWYIYKSLNKGTVDSLKYNSFANFIKNDFGKYNDFIEVYVYLINRYTKQKFDTILRDLIFTRLKKIYSGLIMIIPKVINESINTADNFIRYLFDKNELDKINLGKIFIGYKNKLNSYDYALSFELDTEEYEQKFLTTLYVDLHNKVREIEHILKQY